jgi:hypothetical protein
MAAAVVLVSASVGALAAAPRVGAMPVPCVYYVKVFAYVRENPSPNSKILKSKGAFERVTGPCRSSNGFIAVYTTAASDGIGWIDRTKLYT